MAAAEELQFEIVQTLPLDPESASNRASAEPRWNGASSAVLTPSPHLRLSVGARGATTSFVPRATQSAAATP